MGFLTELFGGSERQQTTQSSTFLSPFQQPFLQQQFQSAQNLAQAQAGPISQQAFGSAQQLGQQGQDFLGGLGSQAGGQLDPFIGQGPTQQQIGSLGDLLQRNLGQSLGQVNQQAVGSGGFGGARQGLAQGQAIGDTQLAFGAGTAQILGQDVQRRQDAALGQAGIQGQTALGGLGSLQSLFNLGLSPFGAQFQPLQQAANVIGGPIRETQATGQATGTGTPGIIPGLAGTTSFTFNK